MLFSIVVPYHNSATNDRNRMISELLSSIPDRPDVEVVLVNDHSEHRYPGTPAYRHASFMHIDNAPDQRFAGTARNRGIEASTGEALIFADSDDLFVSSEFGAILDHVAASGSWDMVLFGVTSFDHLTREAAGRHQVFECAREAYRDTGDRDWLLRLHPPHGRILRRTFVERCGLSFEATRYANDVRFGVLAGLFADRVECCDRVAYSMRTHESSLTTDHAAPAIRQRLGVLFRVNVLLRRQGRDLRFSTLGFLRRFFRTDPLLVVRLARWSLFRKGAVLVTLREIRHLLPVRAKT